MNLRKGVALTPTDDGIVLLDEHSGHYWHLNPTAALIANTLLTSAADAERCAAQALAIRYGLTDEQADRDVATLSQALRKAGLVTV